MEEKNWQMYLYGEKYTEPKAISVFENVWYVCFNYVLTYRTTLRRLLRSLKDNWIHVGLRSFTVFYLNSLQFSWDLILLPLKHVSVSFDLSCSWIEPLHGINECAWFVNLKIFFFISKECVGHKGLEIVNTKNFTKYGKAKKLHWG